MPATVYAILYNSQLSLLVDLNEHLASIRSQYGSSLIPSRKMFGKQTRALITRLDSSYSPSHPAAFYAGNAEASHILAVLVPVVEENHVFVRDTRVFPYRSEVVDLGARVNFREGKDAAHEQAGLQLDQAHHLLRPSVQKEW